MSATPTNVIQSAVLSWYSKHLFVLYFAGWLTGQHSSLAVYTDTIKAHNNKAQHNKG